MSGEVFVLSRYLVGYVDLLGQADQLAGMNLLPHTKKEREKVIWAAQNSAGRVRDVRNSFNEIASTINEHNPTFVQKVRAWGFTGEVRPMEIVHRGFSDTFVFTISLRLRAEGGGAAVAGRAILLALSSLAVLYIRSLASGIPFRGGVDIGFGLNLFPDEVYGPVLTSAYRLESQVAEYPRVVIGRGLLQYLRDLERLPSFNWQNRAATRYARECKLLICDAPDDSQPMLHPLSPALKKSVSEDDRREARSWTATQRENFKIEQNDKLWRRYSRLSSYFEVYESRSPRKRKSKR